MKTKIIASAIFAFLTQGAFAQATPKGEPLSGSVELSTSSADVSGSYPDARIQAVSFLFNGKGKDKIGTSVTAMDAWGQSANYYTARWLANFNANQWMDASVGFSDKGTIAAKHRVTMMYNVSVPGQNLIASAGLDHYAMRGGAEVTGVKTQAVYYAQSIPLVVQASVGYSQTKFNQRGGATYGVSATYGNQGNWTITAAANTGRVHYELLTQPGTVADYHSSTYSLTGRYWVEPSWGLSLGVSQVRNDYYTRDEIRGSTFWKF